MNEPREFQPVCPAPLRAERVIMAHGGGGRLMHNLVRDVFAAAFACSADHDGTVAELPAGRIATTIDGYVVRPMFFPGGDIGSMAIHGTVNDLAMCGARPVSLAAAFIIEEGTEIELLRRIAQSMAVAARKAGVAVSTGDTKVVERGHGDGVYITTSGIGLCEHGLDIHPRSIREGDVLLLSGDVGRHGMAVVSARENLSLESDIVSDSQCLWPAVCALLEVGVKVHCLRDLTRGGLATALVELAQTAGLEIELEEAAVRVEPAIQGACEILGLDPLYVANEGRFVAAVPAADAEAALAALRATPEAEGAVVAGRVLANRPGQVSLRTRIGTLRNLPMLSGDQLPRIC
jgi:hydrogenase expression/formation protein HypE